MNPIQQTQSIAFKWVMAGGASLFLTLAAGAQCRAARASSAALRCRLSRWNVARSSPFLATT
jgi:hypothetical protein